LAKAHAAGSTVAGYGRAGWGSGRYVTGQQRDFANRLRWAITPSYAAANHPPMVTVADLDRRAAAGDTVVLEGVVRDPDGNALTSKWWEYKDVDTYTGSVAFSSTSTPRSSLVVPADAKPGQTIHAILEVTDNGKPALTRYARVCRHGRGEEGCAKQRGCHGTDDISLTSGTAPARSAGRLLP
jgi:hypothetical protein